SFRREHPELFRSGSYSALAASGTHAEHVCAFARSTERERAVTVVPRLLVKLWREDERIDWGDTTLTLPTGSYRCLLTGARVDATAPVPLGQLLAELPVALLAAV